MLGRRRLVAGLLAAVDRFQSPLVNAPRPDLVFEEALQHNRLVYVQAPIPPRLSIARKMIDAFVSRG